MPTSRAGSTRLKKRAAHNSIFFLFPAVLGLIVPISVSAQAFPPSWHVPCWATLSKICFEGTKKPIGWFAVKQHRDRHPVSRPPFVVAAREARIPAPPPSTHFDLFFAFFYHSSRKSLAFSSFSRIFLGNRTIIRVFFDSSEWFGRHFRRFFTLEKAETA